MPIELSTLPIVVQWLIGGLTYGLLGYIRILLDPRNPESFSLPKIGSTLLFSLAIGVVCGVLGIQPTYEHYVWGLSTFAGTIYLFEKSLQAIVKGNQEDAVEHLSDAGEQALSTILSLGGTRESVTESFEEGAAEYQDKSDEEIREEWERDAYLQVDDPEGDEPLDETVNGVPVSVSEETNDDTDADETESGLSPP